MEDEQVFADTHGRVLEAGVQEGILDGLRRSIIRMACAIRERYLERLRAAAPKAWIVVEKILEPGERLPRHMAGRGHDGLRLSQPRRGFVSSTRPGRGRSRGSTPEFTGELTDYATVVHDKKMFTLREVLGSDVNRLTDLPPQICEHHRRHRDYSRHHLTDALRELIAWFPVYRTYVRPAAGIVADSDREYVDRAVSIAGTHRPDVEPQLFAFLRDLLLLELRGDLEHEFVARFQQLTGPAMAKGVEDTAFYTYNRFIALNEVGGDPSIFSTSVEQFHTAARERQTRWPQAMLATSTHDTKRSEDVRMRLAVLSEMPEKWMEAVRRWSELTVRHRRGAWPDRNTGISSTRRWSARGRFVLSGSPPTWKKPRERPRFTHRGRPPMKNTTRRSSRSSSGRLPTRHSRATWSDLWNRSSALDESNSLAQTLIKLHPAPGVPDLYQGTELWSLHLVEYRITGGRWITNSAGACSPGSASLLRVRCGSGPMKAFRKCGSCRMPCSYVFGVVMCLARTAPIHLFSRLDRRGPGHRIPAGWRCDDRGAAPRPACTDDETTIQVPPGVWQNVTFR